ncbi:MAG TPA: phage tail tip lysozyme [Candidatus Bathyarchaeia archaeon]|nr:phage tail tip lysozyme [Candidatus Bathyarchaeia archaeon]
MAHTVFWALRFAVLIFACLLHGTNAPLVYAADVSPSPTPSAADLDRRYRETNDVLYYDHNCASGSAAPTSSAGAASAGGCGNPTNNDAANEKQIHDYFVKQFESKGYSQDEAEKATAGILGNWLQESGFNPARNDGQGCGGPAAYGVAQWCGDRIDKVKKYLSDHGLPADCLGGEMEYAWSEMEQRGLIEKMKGEDPATAAATYMQLFEQASIDGDREGKAQAEYAKMTGTAAPSAQTASTTTTSSDTSSAKDSSSGCNSGAYVNNDGNCQNPFRDLKDSGVSRLDGGYDYGGPNGSGPIYAACPATIVLVQTSGSGWPGLGTGDSGAYIKYQMTAGKAKGLYMYIAEDCTPAVQVGDQVDTSKPICNYKDQGTELETGWASGGGGDGYVEWSDYTSHDNNWASNSGVDIDKFLQTLGAPHDNINEGPSTTPPPADWPKW